jgi:hypothetical protein
VDYAGGECVVEVQGYCLLLGVVAARSSVTHGVIGIGISISIGIGIGGGGGLSSTGVSVKNRLQSFIKRSLLVAVRTLWILRFVVRC